MIHKHKRETRKFIQLPDEVIRERLLTRYRVDENRCWIWTGTFFKDGYGALWDGHQSRKASRLSFKFFKGDIPDGMLVCHSCDIPACINPEHLFAGTYKDNTHDALRKGRVPIGDRHWTKRTPERVRRGFRAPRKLTDQVVVKIRNDPRPHQAIAQELGVAQSTVTRIKNRTRFQAVL